MRVLVLYDLPSTDGEDRRAYSLFHRYLIQNGFLMLQESVYCKLALNMTAVQAILANLRRNKPAAGLIQVLCITENSLPVVSLFWERRRPMRLTATKG